MLRFARRFPPRAAFALAIALATFGILLASGAVLNTAFNERRVEQSCAEISSIPIVGTSNSSGVVNAEILRNFPLGIRCTFERADGSQFQVLRHDEPGNLVFLAAMILMALALLSFVVGGISNAVNPRKNPTELAAIATE
jgi:hypothetical protein